MRYAPLLRLIGMCLLMVGAGCVRREVAATASPVAEATEAAPVIIPLPMIADDHPEKVKVGNLDKAETAQANAPDDPTANRNLAFTYYKIKSYADAARVFDRLTQLTPNDPEPLLYLGYTQMAVGALDRAIESFNRVLALKGVAHSVMSEALYNMGVCQAALGQRDKAIESYVKSLTNDPKNGLASLALGARAAERGQMAQAKDFFTEAAIDLPDSRHRAQAYAALGKIAESSKDTKTATAQYKKSLAIDRDNEWAVQGMQRLTGGKKG